MASKIDLNNGGVYHFTYQFNPEKGNLLVLEELLEQIASHLRGHHFITEQRAELLVIANDSDNHIYVLNNPTKWALDKFQSENRGTNWEKRRIDNGDIRRIIVRNMVLSGKDSEILIAQPDGRTRQGYCFLTPDYLNLNTQELGALIEALIALRLLRVGKSSQLTWLRQQYQE